MNRWAPARPQARVSTSCGAPEARAPQAAEGSAPGVCWGMTCIQRLCHKARAPASNSRTNASAAGGGLRLLRAHQHNLLLIPLQRLRQPFPGSTVTRGVICYLDCKSPGNKTNGVHFINGMCHPFGLQASLRPIKHRGARMKYSLPIMEQALSTMQGWSECYSQARVYVCKWGVPSSLQIPFSPSAPSSWAHGRKQKPQRDREAQASHRQGAASVQAWSLHKQFSPPASACFVCNGLSAQACISARKAEAISLELQADRAGAHLVSTTSRHKPRSLLILVGCPIP